MIGTDSHTPNAGGLGMVAIGVGGADAVDVMTGFPFNVRWPKLIGVHLTGELSGWSSAEGRDPQGRRDPHGEGRHRRHRRVLRSRRRLHHRHRQGHDLQHGRRDRRHHVDLRLRRQHGRLPEGDRTRGDRRRRRRGRRPTSGPTPRSRPTREQFFDRVIEIDLSTLAAAHQRPRHARPRPRGEPGRRLGQAQRRAHRGVLGARRLVHQLVLRGHHPGRVASPARPRPRGCGPRPSCSSRPGSEQVRATIERDGLLADLEAIGGEVLANACGPCIGQWERTDLDPSKVNTIVNSYNRNFPKRNDGNANTKAFVTVARHGHRLRARRHARVQPAHRRDHHDRRRACKLEPPVGEDLPRRGFDPGESGFLAPPDRRRRRRGRRQPRLRAPAAARAVPGLGRQGLRRAARCS